MLTETRGGESRREVILVTSITSEYTKRFSWAHCDTFVRWHSTTNQLIEQHELEWTPVVLSALRNTLDVWPWWSTNGRTHSPADSGAHGEEPIQYESFMSLTVWLHVSGINLLTCFNSHSIPRPLRLPIRTWLRYEVLRCAAASGLYRSPGTTDRLG